MSLWQRFINYSEQFWLVVFSVTLALWLVPALILIPRLYDSVYATSWVLTEDIDNNSTDLGHALSLTMLSTNYPAVAYYDSAGTILYYSERTSGGTWSRTGLDSGIGFGDITNHQTSMGINPADNKPVIIYRHNNFGTTKLYVADQDSSGNWTTTTITTTSTASYIKSAIAFNTANKPIVAYIERGVGVTYGGVLYTALNTAGTVWSTSTVLSSTGLYSLDGVGIVVQSASSATNIAYRDGSDIKFAYSAAGGPWAIDPNVIDGSLTSAASGGGIVYMSLLQDSNGILNILYVNSSANVIHGVRGATGVWTTTTVASTADASWLSAAYNSTSNYFGVSYKASTASTLVYGNNSSGTWSTETASSTNDPGNYSGVTFFGTSPVLVGQFNNVAASIHHPALISAASTFGNTAPSAPTTPYSSATTAQSGSTNPTNLATGTPAFSALFQDVDAGNTATKAQIQVTTSTDSFTTVTHWDSGSSGNTISSVAIGARSADIFYNNFGTAAVSAIGINDDSGEANPNTTYYWRIRFWDATDAGTWSAQQTFSILDTPSPPTAVNATFTQTTSTINWTDNSSIEDAVEVAISTDNTTYSHSASSSAASQVTTSTTGLSPNTLYYYKARAYNSAGYSAYSTATSGYTLANTPNSTAASSTNAGQVSLSWDPNSNSATTEYYALNVTSGTYVGWITYTWTTFSNLEGAKTYTFQVKARNGNNVETDYTSVFSTTTLAFAPTAPTLTQNGDSVIVSWGANNNSSQAEYYVENTTTGANSGWINASTYTAGGLSYGTPYTFQVKARNADGIETTATTAGSITLARVGGTNSGNSGNNNSTPEVVSGGFSIADVLGNQEFTSSTSVNLSIAASTNVTEYSVSNDPGFEQSAWKPITSVVKNWNLVAGTGVRTVYMKFRSSSGKISDVYADSINLDQTPPEMPQITLPLYNDSEFKTAQPTFAGFAEVGSTVYLKLFPNQDQSKVIDLGSVSVEPSGAWSAPMVIPIPVGKNTLVVVAKDSAGNISSANLRIFSVVDQAPPTAPVVRTPEEGSIVDTGLVTTSGNAEPLTTIIVVRDNLITYQTTTLENTRWFLSIPQVFGNGEHVLEYYAYDQSNNQSPKVTIHFTVNADQTLLLNPPPNEETPLIDIPPIETPPNEPPPPIRRIITPLAVDNQTPNVTPTDYPRGTGGNNTGTGGEVSGGGATAVVSGGGGSAVVPSAPPPTVSEVVVSPDASSDLVSAVQKQITTTFVAVTENILEVVSEAPQKIIKQAKVVSTATVKTAKAVRKIADKPQVQTANKAVVAPTVAAVSVVAVSTAVGASQAINYFQFLFLQPLYLLNRKKRRGWGVAYHGITKMPIDLATVRLVDATTKKVIQSRVTDRQGRYAFSAQKGAYVIDVTKQNFVFPPEYLKGKTEDGHFADIYTGGEIDLKVPTTITPNIPLDPVGADKPTTTILKEELKKYVIRIISFSGVLVAAGSFVVTPTPIMGGVVLGHTAMFFVFRRFSHAKKPKGAGIIYDASKKPLEKAIVRIFDTQYNKLLETQVTSARGEYSFLVGKNNYYIMVEKQGFEKYISQPITIGDSPDGSLIATDIQLKVATITEKSEITTPVNIPKVETATTATPEAQPQPTAVETITTNKVSYVPKEFLPLADVSAQATQTILKPLTLSVSGSQTKTIVTEEKSPTILEPKNESVIFQSVKPSVEIKKDKQKEIPVFAKTNKISRLLMPMTTGSRDFVITNEPDFNKNVAITNSGDFLAGMFGDKRSEHVVTNHGGDLLAAVESVEKRFKHR